MPPAGAAPNRPVVHATPPSGWMNDPNGLVHHDGLWHLCYQHHPDSLAWGPMHWGHAVSTDLLTWTDLPVALAPDQHGAVFSGSAVVDHEGTAGYGRDALIAFYTAHLDGDRGQCLAASVDGGRSWTPHPHNPVLPVSDEGPDFRDPRVLRFTDRRGRAWWVMVVASGACLRFHRSEDLVHWRRTSVLTGLTDDRLGVLETPELLELEVAGGPERAWLLSFGHTVGGPHGGSAARYLVGSFDGERFTPTHGVDEVRWVDHGADLYALQAWTGPGDGRRVWIGWMSNWAYADQVPATTWRGMQSIPREVRLVRAADGSPVLAQRPIRELDARRRRLVDLHAPELAAARSALAGVGAACLDIQLTVAVPHEADGRLELGVHAGSASDDGSGTSIAYDAGARRVEVDRGRSGPSVAPGFPTCHRSPPLPRSSEVVGGCEVLTLRILTDTCSVEVFAAEGTVVLSDLVFPAPEATGIRLEQLPVGARILHLDVGAVEVG